MAETTKCCSDTSSEFKSIPRVTQAGKILGTEVFFKVGLVPAMFKV